MWIGLMGYEFEDFYQFSDGTFMDYEAWEYGQPGNDGFDEDCGGFHGTDKWHDFPCEAHFAYACGYNDQDFSIEERAEWSRQLFEHIEHWNDDAKDYHREQCINGDYRQAVF